MPKTNESIREWGVVTLQGKGYVTVARRVHEFRMSHPDWRIVTEILDLNADRVMMCAHIYAPDSRPGEPLSSGHAEEWLREPSSLEKCETSAVGRALAILGYGGQDIASAEDMERHQNEMAERRAQNLLAAFVRNIDTIQTIKTGLATDDMETASEAWFELDDEEKKAIWVAPTKGGIFTTAERETIKTSEFRDAYFKRG